MEVHVNECFAHKSDGGHVSTCNVVVPLSLNTVENGRGVHVMDK